MTSYGNRNRGICQIFFSHIFFGHISIFTHYDLNTRWGGQSSYEELYFFLIDVILKYVLAPSPVTSTPWSSIRPMEPGVCPGRCTTFGNHIKTFLPKFSLRGVKCKCMIFLKNIYILKFFSAKVQGQGHCGNIRKECKFCMASLKHSVTKRKLKTKNKTFLVTEPSKLWFFYGDVKIKVRPHSANFWLKLPDFCFGFQSKQQP